MAVTEETEQLATREFSRQGPLRVTELQHLPLAGPPPAGQPGPQMSGSHVQRFPELLVLHTVPLSAVPEPRESKSTIVLIQH